AAEYVRGHTMAVAIDRLHALDPGDLAARAEARVGLLRAFVSTCHIVAYAHSEGVVHGDVKPRNIMIDDFGATRLLDWGLARRIGPGARAGAPGLAGPRPGTPAFMSSFDTPTTSASDISALGQPLLWILAAQPSAPLKPPAPAPDSPRAL